MKGVLLLGRCSYGGLRMTSVVGPSLVGSSIAGSSFVGSSFGGNPNMVNGIYLSHYQTSDGKGPLSRLRSLSKSVRRVFTSDKGTDEERQSLVRSTSTRRKKVAASKRGRSRGRSLGRTKSSGGRFSRKKSKGKKDSPPPTPSSRKRKGKKRRGSAEMDRSSVHRAKFDYGEDKEHSFIRLSGKRLDPDVKSIWDCYDAYPGIEIRMSPLVYDHFVLLVAVGYGVGVDGTGKHPKEAVIRTVKKKFLLVLKEEARHFHERRGKTAMMKGRARLATGAKFVLSEVIGFFSPPVLGSLAATAAITGLEKATETTAIKELAASVSKDFDKLHQWIDYPPFNPYILRDYFGDGQNKLVEDYKLSIDQEGPMMELQRGISGHRRKVRPSAGKLKAGRGKQLKLPKRSSGGRSGGP